jgi:hypothetical protein
MPTLSEYTNVYGTAISLLEGLGYQVWHDGKQEMYCAEKGGWDFWADSPVGLLGLVKMYEMVAPEEFSEYWWRVASPADHFKLPKKPKPYQPVWQPGRTIS